MNIRIKQLVSNPRLLLFLRLALGCIFIAASMGKVANPADMERLVTSYNILPENLAQLVGTFLPWVEFIIGSLLILGIFPRLTSGISLVLIAGFAVANSCSLLYGSEGSCGCFGQVVPLSHTQSLFLDGVMLMMAVPLLLRRDESWFAVPRISAYKVFVLATAIVLVLNPFLTPASLVASKTSVNDTPVAISQPAALNTISCGGVVQEEDAVGVQPCTTPMGGSIEERISNSLQSSKAVFLFFYADWCGYCKKQKPIIDALEQQYSGQITFLRLNNEKDPEAFDKFGVSGFPTMYIITAEDDNGNYISQEFDGLTDEVELKASFDPIISRGSLSQGTVSAAADPSECTAHCDCPQGQFCYYGTCLSDPKMPVYCCTNPGCPPGRWCFKPDGQKGTCPEQPEYECQSACDCGPAHACMYVPEVGGKRCIKDVNDPWDPGGTALFGMNVTQGVDPTYCCSDPLCHAGRYGYGSNAESFGCYDTYYQEPSKYCGGKRCRSACDCDPGESCFDTRTNTVLPMGAICDQTGGRCVSNAIAEAVYGYSPADFLPCCDKGCWPGEKCVAGWMTGGLYLATRVVSICPYTWCNNDGVCDETESFRTCPQDCKYCLLQGPDGRCTFDEFMMGDCPADCGDCGDGTCSGFETPKNCPQDCTQIICGDGSCDASEVTTCPQDCVCPDSPNFFDYPPTFCGDGYCVSNPPGLEDCFICPQDCGPPPVINEFVINHVDPDPLNPDLDTHEFVEIFGQPSSDYSTLRILQIEGDGTTERGIIDTVLSVGTTDSSGFWKTAFMSDVLENGTSTLLLVGGFTGSAGIDLDTDDDGILDSHPPWSDLADSVSVTDGDAGDALYSSVVLDPVFFGLTDTTGGASRIPDGDKDNWVRNDFDGAGLPGFIGALVSGEALNTPGATNSLAPPCQTHCDCPQGQFCYYGKCITDPKNPIYCCSLPGCPPGRWCIAPDGSKSVCAEDPDYECQNQCDCGPAHACMYVPEVGGKRCIKDVDDPWFPGGTALFNMTVTQGVDSTYCCSESNCEAGRLAYGSAVDDFRCYDNDTGLSSNSCGGRCFYAGDCEPGESCVEGDIVCDSLPAGAICNPEGGMCVSNAVAEGACGWKSSDLLPACTDGCPSGMKCEVGWKVGGPHLVERVVGECGSCGNGVCDEWESHRTCPDDCKYCLLEGPDGRCEAEEVLMGDCPVDCGDCGDGTCGEWETPKNCPQDCTQITCGDGSCDSSEVSTCPQDCGCPGSATFIDYPSFCGDGYCDPSTFSRESSATCPRDCGSVAVTITSSDDPGAYEGSTLTAVGVADTALTYSYVWWVGGISTGQTGNTLNGDYFNKGDVVMCKARGYDGAAYSNWVESNSITIQNSLPSAPTVAVTPSSPYVNHDLVCSASGSADADGDTIVYTYAWYKDNVPQITLTSPIVTASDTAKGEVWKCVVTPWDGEGNGGPSGEDEVTILNSVPVFSDVVNANQIVQYSDDIAPISVTASDVDGDDLTLSLAWGMSGPPGTFTVTPAGPTNTGSWTVDGSITLPTGTYPAELQLTDTNGASSEYDITITVSQEDASINFDQANPVAQKVATAGSNTGPFTLTTYIKESYDSGEPSGEPNVAPGDIAFADVTAALSPVGPGSSVSGTVTLGAIAGAGYEARRTITIDFDNVPVNTYTLEVNVTGGYYVGRNEDVLVVFDPSLGFTTGGGWFYWPGTDDKTNFGYTMKYNKKGQKVKGSLLLIRHMTGGSIYRVKSNALEGLSLGEASGLGWASFSGKATYKEPGWPEPIGNHEFVVYVEDHGDPGKGSDQFWIEMRDSDGNTMLYMSMERDPRDHTETILGGNIVVPHE